MCWLETTRYRGLIGLNKRSFCPQHYINDPCGFEYAPFLKYELPRVLSENDEVSVLVLAILKCPTTRKQSSRGSGHLQGQRIYRGRSGNLIELTMSIWPSYYWPIAGKYDWKIEIAYFKRVFEAMSIWSLKLTDQRSSNNISKLVC